MQEVPCQHGAPRGATGSEPQGALPHGWDLPTRREPYARPRLERLNPEHLRAVLKRPEMPGPVGPVQQAVAKLLTPQLDHFDKIANFLADIVNEVSEWDSDLQARAADLEQRSKDLDAREASAVQVITGDVAPGAITFDDPQIQEPAAVAEPEPPIPPAGS